MSGRPRSNYRNQPRFPVTVPRGSFRSFSGRRSPHANRKRNKKRNINEVPVPYNYTDTQKWHTFYTNGRLKFHKNCILLCDVSYGYVEDTFWEESHSHIREEHAEVKALQRIMAKERDFGSSIRWMTMYLSYSPCANCADRIIQFSWDRPQCDITIAFSCLFRHTEKLHHDGLRRLNAESRITIKVFTKNDWKRLAQETDINFTEYAPRRDQFDEKWRAILRQILSHEIGPQIIPKNMRLQPLSITVPRRESHTSPSHPATTNNETRIEIEEIGSQIIPQTRRLQPPSIAVPRREHHTSPSHPATTNNENRIEIEEIGSQIIPQDRRLQPLSITVPRRENHTSPSHPATTNNENRIEIEEIFSQIIPQDRRLQPLSITVPRRENHTSPSDPATTNNETRIEIEEISGSIQGLRRKKKKQIIIITSFVILIAIITILTYIFYVQSKILPSD